MMRRTRSKHRPSGRAAVAKTRMGVALTETLEGRWLLSAGGESIGGLPGSVLAYVYVGPLAAFRAHAAESGAAKGTLGTRASPRPTRAPAAAPARAGSASAPPSVAPAQTEADRPTITGSYPAAGARDIPPDAFI